MKNLSGCLMALVFVVLTTIHGVSAFCDVRYPAPGTLTAINGTIMSDPDGVMSDYTKNSQYRDCKWHIQCPTGQNAIRFFGDFGRKGLHFYRNPEIPKDKQVIASRFGGGDTSVPHVIRFPFPSITVQYTDLMGFTLHWNCVSETIDSPNATATLGDEGMVLIDTKESGGYVKWDVACSNSAHYVEYLLEATSLLPKDTFKIAGLTATAGYNRNRNVMTRSSTLSMVFNGDWNEFSKNAVNRRIAVYWKCHPERWFGSQSLEKGVMLYSTNRAMLPNRPHFPEDMDKTFSMTCSSSETVALYTQAYFRGRLIIADGNTTLYTRTGTPMSVSQSWFFSGHSSATLRIDSSASAINNFGQSWSVRFLYDCIPLTTNCSAKASPTTAMTTVVATGATETATITSDLDGLGFALRPSGESCVLNWTCADPTEYLSYTEEVRTDGVQLVKSPSVTGLYLTTIGSDKIYRDPHCTGKCHSPQYMQTLTAASGVIKTDADGAGNATMTYAYDDCSDITVSCPAGYSYIKFNSTRNDLRLTLRNKTDNTFIGRLYKGFARASEVNVSYTYSSFRSRKDGSDINYFCSTGACEWVHNTFDAYRGEVKGTGVEGEKCEVTITCPAGTKIGLQDSLSGVTSGFSVTYNASGLTGTSLDSGAMKYFDSPTVILTYTGSTSSVVPNHRHIYYECTANPNCQSPNGTDVTFSGDSGTLLTDVDGMETVWNPSENATCNWTVECPAGKNQILWDINPGGRSITSTEFYLKEYHADGVNFTTLSLPSVSPTVYPYNKKLTLEWNRNSGFLSREVKWQCLPYAPTCKHPLAGKTITDTSGTIDYDPTSSHSAHFELCNWKIACPSGNVFIRSVKGKLHKYSSIRFVNTATSQVARTISGVNNVNHDSGNIPLSFADAFGLGFSSVTIEVNGTSYAYDDFQIMWQCRADTCSSSSISGETITARSGTIKTDVDGSGATHVYAADESCNWPVKCADHPEAPNKTYTAIRVQVSGKTTGSGNHLEMYNMNKESQEVLTARWFDNFASNAIYMGNTTRFQFRTVSSGIGATITYECLEDNVVLASKSDPLIINGSVSTDSSWTKSVKTIQGARSPMYTLQCLDGGLPMVETNRGGLRMMAHGVNPVYYNTTLAQQMEELPFKGEYMGDFHALMGSQAVNVSFHGYETSTSSVQVKFKCLTSPMVKDVCNSIFSDTVYPGGLHGRIVVAIKNIFNLNCNKTVQCPAGHSLDMYGVNKDGSHSGPAIMLTDATNDMCLATPYGGSMKGKDEHATQLLGRTANLQLISHDQTTRNLMHVPHSGTDVDFHYHCVPERTAVFSRVPAPERCSVRGGRKVFSGMTKGNFDLKSGHYEFDGSDKCMWKIATACAGRTLWVRAQGDRTERFAIRNISTVATEAVLVKTFCYPAVFDERFELSAVDEVEVYMEARGRGPIGSKIDFRFGCSSADLDDPKPAPSGAAGAASQLLFTALVAALVSMLFIL